MDFLFSVTQRPFVGVVGSVAVEYEYWVCALWDWILGFCISRDTIGCVSGHQWLHPEEPGREQIPNWVVIGIGDWYKSENLENYGRLRVGKEVYQIGVSVLR